MKNHPVKTTLHPVRDCISKEEALELLLENKEDIFMLVDRQLKVIISNNITKERIFKSLGIELHEGMDILKITNPLYVQEVKKAYSKVFEGIACSITMKINIAGEDRFYDNKFRPALNHEGHILAAIVTSRDVTQEVLSSNNLREFEERWRFALEGSKQGVWDWNLETDEMFYSSSYKKMYGFEEHELSNKVEEWKTRIHPDDAQMMQQSVQEHVRDANPFYESVYRLQGKDQKYRWIMARGMVISKDIHNKPLRMIGIHTDITERKTAEENYKLLFYSNPIPMWTYDFHSLRFIEVNDAAIRHYGYSREEFLSMTIKDIRPKEDLPKFELILKKRQCSNKYNFPYRHLKKNGEIIMVDISTNLLENESEEKTILVLAHDITEKIRVEEKLKEINARFEIASKATSDAIYDWNILSGQIHWGEGIKTLFGFMPDAVSIDKWETLIHPDDRSRVLKSLQDMLKSNQELWQNEYRFYKADDRFSYVLDRAYIIRDEQGRPERMIGSMQDISARKYSEQLLSLERSVFELSTNRDIPFHIVLEQLLEGLEALHPEAYTSILLLKKDGSINPFAAPRLPKNYCSLLKGLKLGPEDGSCGAAIHSKETVIVDDIENDPLWKNFVTVVKPYDLKACWSLPIINSAGSVMGTFAIYYLNPRKPEAVEISTLERMRNIIRILMENYFSIKEINLVNERFDIMLKATHDLIWDWNLVTNEIFRDEHGLQQVYGVKNKDDVKTIHSWLSRIHPADKMLVKKGVYSIIQGQEKDVFELEYRFKRDNGRYAFVYDRGMIIRNEKGVPVRMIGAAQDITDRKKLERDLLTQELEKQKAINKATIDTQEKERSEIGRELHDNVNQVLTTTKLYLELAQTNPDLSEDLIKKSTANVINVINEIRQLSRSLMHANISDLGLVDSMKDLIESINLTKKITLSLVTENIAHLLLSQNLQLNLFRLVQEALNNSLKHSEAKTAIIHLEGKPGKLVLIIKDDGKGFDLQSVRRGSGLKNIENRVYLHNGTLSIQTNPGAGCVLTIEFPLLA